MARAKSKTPSPAAIALRGAAAELERQAAALRAKADLLDGGAASTAKAISKAKPKKAAKAKLKKAAKKGAKRKAAKKAKPRQTDLERDFLPKGARGRAKPMPAGALKKLKGAHANGAAHPAIRPR